MHGSLHTFGCNWNGESIQRIINPPVDFVVQPGAPFRLSSTPNVLLHRCVKDSVAVSGLVLMETLVHRSLGLYRGTLDRLITPSRFYRDKLARTDLGARIRFDQRHQASLVGTRWNGFDANARRLDIVILVIAWPQCRMGQGRDHLGSRGYSICAIYACKKERMVKIGRAVPALPRR